MKHTVKFEDFAGYVGKVDFCSHASALSHKRLYAHIDFDSKNIVYKVEGYGDENHEFNSLENAIDKYNELP